MQSAKHLEKPWMNFSGRNRNMKKFKKAIGTVVNSRTVMPENCRKNNSKWAKVCFVVEGKKYTSENFIQVSMAKQVGSKVKIKYDIENPRYVRRAFL